MLLLAVIFYTTSINTSNIFCHLKSCHFGFLKLSADCYRNRDNMRGSEGEPLDAVRQPVVTLSVEVLLPEERKELPDNSLLCIGQVRLFAVKM